MMIRESPRKLDRKTLGEVVKHSPTVSIDLIVCNARNDILLGLRNNDPAKDYWFVPGGRILKNESVAQAFARVSQEELKIALVLQDAVFLGVFEHFYKENFLGKGGFGTHYIVLAYEINLSTSNQLLSDDQHREFRWWGVEELLEAADVHPYTKAYLKEVKKREAL